MDALLKATGDSSGVAESSCDELFSGDPVAILHVPADSAGPLNVARYLAVIRLTAPCSPSARPRHGYPRAGCGTCQVRRGPGGGALRRRLVTVRTRRMAQNGAPTHEIERQGAAGSRAGAWSAATLAARPPDQRYATCRQVLAPAAAWKLGSRGSRARLTVSLVSKLSILPDMGGQEIETADCNDLRLRSAVRHRLRQSTIAYRG